MRRFVPLFAIGLLVLGSGCGAKSDDTAKQAEPSTTPAPAAASAPDTSQLFAKSQYDDGPRASAGAIDAAKAEAGEKLFQTKGCIACHAWGKRLIGPDLKGVVTQRTAEWMKQQILHPDVMTRTDPIAHQLMNEYHVQMTKQGLTEDEATSVVEYLKQREKSGK